MKIKNFISLFIVYVFISSNSFAQKINYKKFTSSLRALGCGSHSHKDIESDYHKFLLLDSSKIAEKNRIEYYGDYAMNCYNMYCITKNINFATQSNELYKKGLAIDSTNMGLMWNYACNLIILGECDEAKKRFELYLITTPKKYITQYTHEQIAAFEKGCTTR